MHYLSQTRPLKVSTLLDDHCSRVSWISCCISECGIGRLTLWVHGWLIAQSHRMLLSQFLALAQCLCVCLRRKWLDPSFPFSFPSFLVCISCSFPFNFPSLSSPSSPSYTPLLLSLIPSSLVSLLSTSLSSPLLLSPSCPPLSLSLLSPPLPLLLFLVCHSSLYFISLHQHCVCLVLALKVRRTAEKWERGRAYLWWKLITISVPWQQPWHCVHVFMLSRTVTRLMMSQCVIHHSCVSVSQKVWQYCVRHRLSIQRSTLFLTGNAIQARVCVGGDEKLCSRLR